MSRRSTSGRSSGRPGPAGGRRPHRASKQPRAGGGVSPELIDDTAAGRRMSFRTSVIVGALLIVAFGLVQPISSGLTQMQQIAALEADIDATKDEVAQLRDERERLDDPEHLERLARENLQYVHEGEEAFIVVDSPNDHGDEADESEAGASKTVRAQPWYRELVDSLRAVGHANEEDPT
ncbi:MAG TPA: septum formation initiator family protein [Brevibacterium sp.]|nr:septum formation initiator family protein [Brevibacterium sp.]